MQQVSNVIDLAARRVLADAADKPFRLYVDETGDHTRTHATDVGKRYLGLLGVVFREDHHRQFYRELEAFKARHLEYDPDDPPILHREDIVACRKPFNVLKDAERRAAFNSELLELVENSQFRMIMVVVDKHEHFPKRSYRRLVHPYHYGLHALLERYCPRLRKIGSVGDVLAEARGGAEDEELKRVYREAMERGTRFLSPADAQATLKTRELKLKRKESNIAGLQLADMLAHPATREVLREYRRIDGLGSPFAGQLIAVAATKFYRDLRTGKHRGYGKVLLD